MSVHSSTSVSLTNDFVHDSLPNGKLNIVSNIFSELAEAEAGCEPVLSRRRFGELLPMPDALGDVLFRGFCGRDRNTISRSRFIDCVQALYLNDITYDVRVVFGDNQTISKNELFDIMGKVLEGFYLVVFRRSFADGRQLPTFVRHALQECVLQIVDSALVQYGHGRDMLLLSDLVEYIRANRGMADLVSLICSSICNMRDVRKKNDEALKPYRSAIRQIIRAKRKRDSSLKAWKHCASVLALPSPELESTVYSFPVEKGAHHEEHSSSSSTSASQFTTHSLPQDDQISSLISIDMSQTVRENPPKTAENDEMSTSPGSYQGVFKVCKECEMAIDARFCVECGAALKHRRLNLACDGCAAEGFRLRYRFCARCGSGDLLDRRLNLDEWQTWRRTSAGIDSTLADSYLKRRPHPKRGIRGFVSGFLQDWFYVFDPHSERWCASWALLSDQFLLLFKRVQIGHPHRIISLLGRTLSIEEYHGEHDEYLIEVSASNNAADDACMIITTDKDVGNMWLQQMRLGTRRRAIEDYYEIGDCVFQLDGLVKRCLCRHKLIRDKFLVTCLDKCDFNEAQIDKIRSSFALFKLLRHSTLIAVKDVFESDTSFSVTVPQLNGGYLIKSLEQKGRFNEAVVRLVIYPILNALVRIHRAGLDLVNLRPECLIVTPHAQHLIQIAHLDLNKFLSPAEVLEMGLPRRLLSYRSPEVLCSGGPTWVWGPPADIWSVGILMFELLSGQLPFEPMPGEFFDYAQVLEEKLASGDVWNDVMDETKDVIRCLLSPDIDRRPSADSLLSHAWFSIRF